MRDQQALDHIAAYNALWTGIASYSNHVWIHDSVWAGLDDHCNEMVEPLLNQHYGGTWHLNDYEPCWTEFLLEDLQCMIEERS